MFTSQNWRQRACWRRFALLSWSSFLVRLSNARSDPRRRLSFPVSVSPQFSHSSAPFSASARTLINREQINQSFFTKEEEHQSCPGCLFTIFWSAKRAPFEKVQTWSISLYLLRVFLSVSGNRWPRPSHSTLSHWWGTRRLWDQQLRWAEPIPTTKCLFNYLEYWCTLIRCKKRSSAICRTLMNSGSKLSHG